MKRHLVKLTASEELFLWRIRSGYKMKEVARMISYRPDQYSAIEYGEMEPDEHHRAIIERVTTGAVPRYRWHEPRQIGIASNEYLALLIRRRKWRITEFCSRAGLNPTRISRIVHRNLTPSVMEQQRIAAVFNQLSGEWLS